MAYPEHLAILKQGVQAWNQWRYIYDGFFRKADLRGANLRESDLRGANFRDANLRDANLTGANLTGANLAGAILWGAILASASLTEADLQEADLGVANLTQADLTGANLTQADLTESDLRGANLRDANLRDANLRDANLTGAKLTAAKLTAAILVSASLTEADLGGANLTGANLTQANLTGAKLAGAKLTAAILVSANLTEADLQEADLGVANLTGAKLTAAILTGAKLTAAILTEANLTGANLTGAILWGANLRKTNLDAAQFRSTILADVDLSSTKGLESVLHTSPSSIGIDTLIRSRGKIPEIFLRGAGVPEPFITNMKALISAMSPIQFYSCFISYSTKDQDFADRLHADLQAKGIRCWFASHDVRGGRKLHEQIDEAIRLHDKLLLVLSPASMASEWVKTEISKARKREVRDGARVLFPISLAPFDVIRDWECFDADAGKDSALEIREYFIPDFSHWKNHHNYQKAFQRLVKDLQTPSQTAFSTAVS